MLTLDKILERGRTDPLYFAKVFFPKVRFFKKQRQIIESIDESVETVVTAANQVGV